MVSSNRNFNPAHMITWSILASQATTAWSWRKTYKQCLIGYHKRKKKSRNKFHSDCLHLAESSRFLPYCGAEFMRKQTAAPTFPTYLKQHRGAGGYFVRVTSSSISILWFTQKRAHLASLHWQNTDVPGFQDLSCERMMSIKKKVKEGEGGGRLFLWKKKMLCVFWERKVRYDHNASLTLAYVKAKRFLAISTAVKPLPVQQLPCVVDSNFVSNHRPVSIEPRALHNLHTQERQASTLTHALLFKASNALNKQQKRVPWWLLCLY